MTFLIRAPATTANLGPGFDCLGMALDLWNETEVEITGDHLTIDISGEGVSTLPKDETNTIFRAMQTAAAYHSRDLPRGLAIRCKNSIPLGSGLGSSSAAIVAGVLIAYSVLDLPNDKGELFNIAAKIEGHPDNVAPCIYGGLVASMAEDNRFIARSFPIHPLHLLIVTPNFSFPTVKAREALPEMISYKSAIFNLSHSILLLEALRTGDLDLLTVAMNDRLHQPFRVKLIPGAENALSAAKSSGAIAVVLSGAGPSLLAVLRSIQDSEEVAQAMRSAFMNAGLETRVFTPKISSKGANVELL